jgi:hypothetical protein
VLYDPFIWVGTIPPFLSARLCTGRLYILHREKKDKEREKEGGHTSCASWKKEVYKDNVKKLGVFQYFGSVEGSCGGGGENEKERGLKLTLVK